MSANIGIFSGGIPSSIGDLFALIGQGAYTTVIVWSANVDSAGDIHLNGDLIAQDGSFVTAQQPWAEQVTALKTNSGTTINRIELSLGSGSDSTFANIKMLIGKYPDMTTNPVYKNLVALQTALTLDAIDYDDEVEYDLDSSQTLAAWCASLGMKVTICPYTNSGYWPTLVNNINAANPGTVDTIYLQAYPGPSSQRALNNNPATWNGYFESTGLVVSAGLRPTHLYQNACTNWTNNSEVEAQVKKWRKETSLAGAWMYCGTDMQNCTAGGTPADYATAIINGFKLLY